jgi:hypothetical protein
VAANRFSVFFGGGSQRHIVRSAFVGLPAPLVVALCGRDVPVAKKLLDLGNIDSGFKEECRSCGSKGVGHTDAVRAIGIFEFANGLRKAAKGSRGLDCTPQLAEIRGPNE